MSERLIPIPDLGGDVAKGVPLWKDLLYAVLIVGGVLGVLTLYTNVWPPMVVVESGSMMHADGEVAYGRIGTIDPGDMVLVKKADGPDDIETFAARGREHYGKPGDVVVYYPNNNTGKTPIIHRALTYVSVEGSGEGRTYKLMWDGRERVFDSRGIVIPELGFDSAHFPDGGYKPPRSGFITRGDNPVTNRLADQAMGLSSIVEPSWIQGKARGELPWFGLIKLGLSPCDRGPPCNQPSAPGSWTLIGYAAAPKDLWVMLAIALAAVIFVPIGYDMAKARWLARQTAPPPPPPPAAPPAAPPATPPPGPPPG